MSTQHTPGPWVVDIVGGYVTHVCVNAEDGCIANIDWGEGLTLDEAKANAALIAAAPELLGALRFILAFYEPGQRHLDTNAWKNAEAGARAAVAKAEGTA